jgi:hypothetical protein
VVASLSIVEGGGLFEVTLVESTITVSNLLVVWAFIGLTLKPRKDKTVNVKKIVL